MPDWERDFRYLTAPRKRPSHDDLYNSLRNVMDKDQAAALAGLFVATFDRIIGIEAPPNVLEHREQMRLADQAQIRTLRGWLDRIGGSLGSADQLREMARYALAGFGDDFKIDRPT